MQGSKGMPIPVQVGAMRWKDERAMRVMRIIDEEF